MDELIKAILDNIPGKRMRALIAFIALSIIIIFLVLFVGTPTPWEKLSSWIRNDDKPMTKTCADIRVPILNRNYSDHPDKLFFVSQNNVVHKIDPQKIFFIQRSAWLSEALNVLDNELRRQNMEQYGSKVLSYLIDTSEVNKAAFRALIDNGVLKFEEHIDTDSCNHSFTIGLSKSGFEKISKVMQLGNDSVCIANVIYTLVIIPLNNTGTVDISLLDIFRELQRNCSNTAAVMNLLSLCDGNENCPKIFFRLGEYELQFASTMILKELAKALAQRRASYSIKVIGSTDHTSIKRSGIRYLSSGYSSREKGIMFPSGNGNSIPETITTNLELSYARSFECYKFLDNFLDTTIFKISYTGVGEDENDIESNQQRAVRLNIQTYYEQ